MSILSTNYKCSTRVKINVWSAKNDYIVNIKTHHYITKQSKDLWQSWNNTEMYYNKGEKRTMSVDMEYLEVCTDIDFAMFSQLLYFIVTS
jgi:hypothetical protein